ncbi:MAG: right-handed parallel beta-helix repeat-containing protein [Treponema sp.]|nr:right-handed parallel beta-helix repeat-containing protein [Treponema sp.]
MRVGIKKVFSKVILWGCLAAVFAHALTSCSFFQEEDVDDDVVAFNAMQEAAIAQGLTLDLLPPGEAAAFYATISGTASTPGDLTRTALPSMNVTQIILRDKATGMDAYTADVITGSAFSFSNIVPGAYTFYAEIDGVISGPYDYTLADGTVGTDLILGSGQVFSGLTLKIVPKMSAGGIGRINLTVNKSPDSGITALSYSLAGGSPITLNFDASGKALISVPDIASGTYTLALTFMAGTSPVYHAVEVVNVYDGLDTNTWQGSSEYIDGSTGAFTVTKTMVDNFARTTFYVSGTGGAYASVADNNNEGTYFKPFKTLTNAVAVVSSSTLNPGTGGFRIFVDGSLSEAGIDFSPASSKKLTISSIGTSTVTIDAKKYGRLFIAGENADLTLVNLVMQNGEMSTSGGGIYVSNGAVLTLTGCTVKDCQTTGTGTNVRGGGIYVSPGASLTMTNCTVTGCQTTDSVGGGIFCRYGSGTSTILSMTNTKITGNKIVYGGTTLSGAGIFIENQAGDYTIGQGCEITGNFADCSNYSSATTIRGIGYFAGNKGTHIFAAGVKVSGNYFKYSDSYKPTVLSTGIHQESGSSLSIGGIDMSSVDAGNESVLDTIDDTVYSKTGKFIRINAGISTAGIASAQRYKDTAVLLNGAVNALPDIGSGSVLYLGKISATESFTFYSDGIINITKGSASGTYTIQKTNTQLAGYYATISGGSIKPSSLITMTNGSAGNWNFNGIGFTLNSSTDGKGAFRIEGTSAAKVTFNKCKFGSCYAYDGEEMGGAIFMNASSCSVTLNATSIINCYADVGGAGVAALQGTLTVDGSNIKNTVSGKDSFKGMDIYAQTATLNLTGSAYAKEIYLDSGKINVTGDLTTDTTMTIVLNMDKYSVGSQIVTGTNLESSVAKFALNNIQYYISSDGKLKKTAESIGGLIKATNTFFKSGAYNGEEKILNLDTDLSIAVDSTSPDNIEGINQNKTGIIYVPSGATLTLKGKATGRTAIDVSVSYKNTQVVQVERGGTLNLENIEFKGANERLPVIRVKGGTVNLKNCKISGDSANNQGGDAGSAITIENNGRVVMDGGEITGCTRDDFTSGGIVGVQGTFIMKGGAQIYDNTLTKNTQGVVYLSSGTFTMESGSGAYVQHLGTGHAVYKKSGTTFNQNGCMVSGTIGP